MWRNWNSYALLVGTWNGTESLKISLADPQKVKQSDPMTQQSPSQVHVTLRHENIYHTNMNTNIPSKVISTNQKVETLIYSLADRWISNLWYIPTMEYYSSIRKWIKVHAPYNLDEPWEHYAKKRNLSHNVQFHLHEMSRTYSVHTDKK